MLYIKMFLNKIFDLMEMSLVLTKFLEGRRRGKHCKKAKKPFLKKWRLFTYASRALIYKQILAYNLIELQFTKFLLTLNVSRKQI